MKLNNKKLIIIWIIFLLMNYINSQDIDFGIFNYKGSRLKNIKRYDYEKNKINLSQEVIYTYDDNGYLIGRNLFGYTLLKQKYPIYESKIEYSEDKKKIKETFIKKFKDKGKWILEEDVFEYQYNDKMQLIKVFREENKGEMVLNLDFKYNEAGDIISSKISFLASTLMCFTAPSSLLRALIILSSSLLSPPVLIVAVTTSNFFSFR